ncbi:MAG: dihydrofolate reductase [Candidatus Marinimicrobia bacterium]|nr:dihydrofolate reductase [Candidatus Neomarinimicrobiota bacterium]
MDIILIAAITADGYIARNENDPVTWSEDLHVFKEQTMGFPVIMGSNTAKTIDKELEGRKTIVVHRDDEPKMILENIKAKKCFIAGGGRTNTMFAPFLTHLYLTIHPLVFGKGIPLFTGLEERLFLELIKAVDVVPGKGIIQYQYKSQKTKM